MPWMIMLGVGGALLFLVCGVGGVILLYFAHDEGLVPLAEDVAAADPEERIRNGDFEQGNRGFRSDYHLEPGNIRPELSYDIVVNPQDAHADAAFFGDHTSGKGRMMDWVGMPFAGFGRRRRILGIKKGGISCGHYLSCC
jgi:hypothetical protein